MDITSKIDDFLFESVEGDIKKGMENAWGSAGMSVVYKNITDKGAWIVVAYHKPTKKYYGVNYMDEVIDKTTEQKAKKWAESFMGSPVTFKKV